MTIAHLGFYLQKWNFPFIVVSAFLHLNGLFRGARRYEVVKDSVKNEEVNIFVGMFKVISLKVSTFVRLSF